MGDTVSCVVPVYNGAPYLEEAISSIEAQTWGPVEIVVVDDGSTDATSEVIAGLGARVRAIRQDNSGAVVARNRGLAAASGSFLAFLDADDLWLPEKITVQMARFAARPEIDVCLCRSENWWIPELRHEAETMPALHNANTRAFPTVLARRSLFERTGPLDGRLRHLDLMEWLLRVGDVRGVVETLDDVLVRRRIHFTNTSRGRGENEENDQMIIAQSRVKWLRRT